MRILLRVLELLLEFFAERLMDEVLDAVSGGVDVVGREADSSAVSGSLRPCPVRVRTIVDPGSKRPALTDLTRPATVAADAGSLSDDVPVVLDVVCRPVRLDRREPGPT